MTRITSEPKIQSLTNEPAVEGFIERFDAAIAERPAAFATALETLGAAATAQTVAIEDEEHSTTHLAVSEEAMIVAYFKHRYDRYVEYDEATEKAIDKDAGYKELLAKHLDQKSVPVMTGKMSSIVR